MKRPVYIFQKHLPVVHVVRHEAKHGYPAKGPREDLCAN